MSPLMQRTLESKIARRKRLMALPYPEKVRIVEQMREEAGEIRATGWNQQAGKCAPMRREMRLI